MKKRSGIICLILLVLFIVLSVNLVYARTCTSPQGYVNKAYYCSDSRCTQNCRLWESYRCEKNPASSCRQSGNVWVKWAYSGSRCTVKWTCADTKWVETAYCNASNAEVRNQSTLRSCGIVTQWGDNPKGTCNYNPSTAVPYNDPALSCSTCKQNNLTCTNSSQCCSGNCANNYCCPAGKTWQAGSCVDAFITSANWTNMRNQPITNADLEDNVKLKIYGGGLQGEEINYRIFNSLNEFIFGDNSTETEITWQAIESGAYFFNASLATGQSFKSGNLQVSNTINNAKPVANITNPKNGEIYFVNENINFTAIIYDEDDEINVTWDFGDGTFSNEHNIVKNYTTDGQKKILLKVEDERGLKAEDRASILIVDLSQDKTYVMPLIHKPRWHEMFLFTSLNLQVWFNSTKSYVINVSSRVINCIAGPCPNQTVNGTPVSGSPKNITDNMKFEWEISNNITYTGFGLNGSYFGVNFPSKGDKFSILNLTLNNFELAFVNFSIGLESFCLNGKWYDENGTEHNPIDEENICNLVTPNCCPSGYACDSSIKKCKLPTVPPFSCTQVYSCSNYTTSEKCNEDICDMGNDGAGTDICDSVRYSGNIAWTTTNCKCKWSNNTCSLNYDSRRTVIISEPNPVFECQKTFAQGTCINEVLNLSWTARVVNNNTVVLPTLAASLDCVAGSKNVNCGAEGVMLPFFSLSNFVFAAVGIFLVYLIFWKKLKK